MITAIDTSVLLDVLADDPKFRQASLSALETAKRAGNLVICSVVWAEVRANFDKSHRLRLALSTAEIRFDPLNQEAADHAGALWQEYRRMGGRREHLIPDFLIAAHAQVQADQLLTRDRGFSRRYFEGLRVIDPGGPK